MFIWMIKHPSSLQYNIIYFNENISLTINQGTNSYEGELYSLLNTIILLNNQTTLENHIIVSSKLKIPPFYYPLIQKIQKEFKIYY